MNVIVEKLPQCRATMRVELSQQEVEAERQKIVQAFRDQARIPGYRPGKIPLSVIQKRFEKEIAEELENRLVQRGTREGIEQEDLDVLAVTNIDSPSIHVDSTFSFTAELQTAPDFELPDYKGIPVQVQPVAVSEEEVDRQMDELRHRLAEFRDVTDRPVQMGDFAVVSFAATLEGQPLDEAVDGTGFLAKGEDQWLRMATDSFIPGFCEAIVGMNAGEEKPVDLEVPDDFVVEALQGETLRYEVTLKGLKEQILPEWTDELAETFGEDMTVEALRDACRQRIEEEKKRRQLDEKTTQILEFLDKHLDFELPDQLLASETQRQVNQIVRQSHERGISAEDISNQKDAIIQHASTQAEVNVKTAFILRQIAEREEIKATENELLAWCSQMAESSGVSVKKYVKQLEKSDGLRDIVDQIVRAKTLEFLREHASVTEVEEEPEDAAASSGETA